MPYLKNGERETFDKIVGQLRSIPGGIEDASQLNFLFSRIANLYFQQHGPHSKTIHDINGAFIGAAQEFYRRVAVPFEDDKVASNGDIYE